MTAGIKIFVKKSVPCQAEYVHLLLSATKNNIFECHRYCGVLQTNARVSMCFYFQIEYNLSSVTNSGAVNNHFYSYKIEQENIYKRNVADGNVS